MSVSFRVCIDVDELERELAARVKRESPATEKPWGRIALFSDPFGHGFCLLELNERGYDALAD